MGGAILLNVINGRQMSSDDPERVVKVASRADFVGRAVLTPAGVVTLLAGLALVLESDVWEFSMGWVIFALIIVIASAMLGIVYYGRRIRAIESAANEHGPDSPQVMAVARQVAVVANVETLALLAVVWVMIFKPGV